MWAPAITTALFKQADLPALKDGSLARFALFALNDKAEQDDNCARIYNKSLLDLVSRAFEKSAFGEARRCSAWRSGWRKIPNCRG
ncbi:MAG: hypothetical protein NVS3B2_17120 [Ramlibacter sp.]